MSSSSHQLIHTEKRLTRLFIIGIFLFLIVFEAIFLISRYYFEQREQYMQFENSSNDIVKRDTRNQKDLPPIPPFLKNIYFLILDTSGNILENRTGGQEINQISDILPGTTLSDLAIGITMQKNGFLIKKINQTNTEKIILFLSPIQYSINKLLIDALRFLFLDCIILMPFSWIARVYVQETLEPVKENINTMNYFIHDAGHELKTPLAILSGNLQFMRDFKEQNMELIEENIKVIKDMNSSIEGLLELADLTLPEQKNKVFLKPLIDTEINKLLINYNTINVQNNVSEKVSVLGDIKHISLLMKNLLENAMKYNKKNGEVLISFEKDILTIQDTGIGIAAEETTRIFDRFYRIHSSEGKDGSGIGLTIVDHIVKLYHWKLSIKSELGRGTNIDIKMNK